jgi:hypothetical protein
MTNSEKIDFLYSKFVSPNTSQTSVFNSQVWSQGNEIPQTLPAFDSNGEYKNSFDEAILKKYEYVKMSLIPGFPNAFSSPTVYDIVSYENGFDPSYEYKFYTRTSNGSYVQIPFGEAGYFFDHDTGILFFPEGRTLLYNPANLYVTFVKYVGRKGINTSSQFPGSPQSGEVGPTGPTGPTGDTGAADPFSIRYKGQWSSSIEYSKWDLVKYDGKFFISTINSNGYQPINGSYWQPFGIPQLSSAFIQPDDVYYVSSSFSTGGGKFNDIDGAFADINMGSFTNATVVVYPGDYVINSNIIVRNGVNVNIIFYGRVNVSFRNDALSLVFNQGSKVEFRGNDFRFENGNIRLVCSSLSVVGGSISNVHLLTTTLLDTSRLMMVNSELKNLINYGSFASLRGTNLLNKITMDEVSVVHIEGCMFDARPNDEPTQEKIEIVSAVTSGTPPGFGYESPSLFIKNSRILSNGAVIYSTIAPLYGMQIGMISSSLYVKDSSTSFLDFSDAMDAFVFTTVVNTAYDDTKLRILNINGGFQTIDANFED